jgi:D-beta-D-heptose 7-phosphate kinase/D-beta-D-heptose 1-phosphate adenosyltransferase
MNSDLAQLIDAFAGLRVFVIGEAMLDTYLEGSAGRFCQEAPAPVVNLSGRSNVPGGAANAAVNVAALGGQVTFLSVIGGDAEGSVLAEVLQERGVATEQVIVDPSRRTLTKQRIVAGGQVLMRVDDGSTDALDAETELLLADRLRELFAAVDAVLVSDYNYGIITPAIVQALAELQAQMPRIVVVDSRRLGDFREVRPTAVKPNYREAMELLGESVSPGASGSAERAEALLPHGEHILDKTGAGMAVVTLDQEGAVLFERGKAPFRAYAAPARNAGVTGAGDTFTSALTLALAAGASATDAVELAAAAAAVVVGKDRTASCSAQELREYTSAGGKHLADLAALTARVDFHRQQGRRIVFTNGCFDILHSGHISYLDRAKTLGDILIVGVNSDAGIKRLKGPSRPINSLQNRLHVLAALGCIDHVVAFDEDTPCNLIRAIRPDVFVKGGDYTRERLPEAAIVEEYGGSVHILPYEQDCSTTGIIERIQGDGFRCSVFGFRKEETRPGLEQDMSSSDPENRKPKTENHTFGNVPHAKPSVSLCMIVKNEAANLPKSLGSAADLFDEVIVVDTGSTDNTRAVAEGFGAKVFDFAWVDSFAAARNESLRHATGEWIFWLDGDDCLDQVNRDKLRRLLDGLGDENAAYVMKCRCLRDRVNGAVTEVDHVRLFRNHPELRWTFRVHEQILPAVRALKGEVRWSDVVIHHRGYQDPALRRTKLERDLRLLHMEDADNPDNAFTLFNFGSVYQELGRYDEAIGYLQRSLQRSHPSDSIVRKLFASVAHCQRKLGRLADAQATCTQGRALFADDRELLLEEGLARFGLKDLVGARCCLERLVKVKPGQHFASVDTGMAGYLGRHNLAVVCAALGDWPAAETHCRAALADRPDYLPTLVVLGDVYLKRNRIGEGKGKRDILFFLGGRASPHSR